MKNRLPDSGAKYMIVGGRRLYGKLQVMSAKNSILPLIACSVMTEGEVFLTRCEMTSDAVNMADIVRSLGGKCSFRDGGIYIDCRDLSSHRVGSELTGRLRSSVFILGPLLARAGSAEICYPGGCDIGPRPIDLHISGLRALGAQISENGDKVSARGALHGARIELPMPSVGATENIMMAASRAEGVTVVCGAAAEPEITDLQNFINACGGKVRGAGTRRLEIEGVKRLHGATFAPSGDRIAAGTYMTACAICGGEVTVTGANPAHLASVTGILRRAGAEVTELTNGATVRSDGSPRAPGRIETAPYPGFPTDLQSPLTALAALSRGTTYIIENLFENRFRHIPQLRKMGADITVCGRAATVRGRRLYGSDVEAEDLRGGAALVLAALGADGTSTVSGLSHIDRGYYDLGGKLSSLGADIRRLP